MDRDNVPVQKVASARHSSAFMSDITSRLSSVVVPITKTLDVHATDKARILVGHTMVHKVIMIYIYICIPY